MDKAPKKPVGKKKKDTPSDEAFIKPEITRDLTGRQARIGSRVVLRVTASGRPLPSYQWFLNGKKISGAMSDRYVIPKMRRAHVGSYTVEAKNYAGSTMSREAALSFLPEKVVELEIGPIVASAKLGQPFKFSVVSPEMKELKGLSLQWLYNGKRINGATGPELNFTEIKKKYQGEYKVILITSSEIISSNVANLTVVADENEAAIVAAIPAPTLVAAPIVPVEDFFYNPEEDEDEPSADSFVEEDAKKAA